MDDLKSRHHDLWELWERCRMVLSGPEFDLRYKELSGQIPAILQLQKEMIRELEKMNLAIDIARNGLRTYAKRENWNWEGKFIPMQHPQHMTPWQPTTKVAEETLETMIKMGGINE